MASKKGPSGIVLIIPVFDEEDRIAEVIRWVPRPPVDEILVVDDGSRDASAERARAAGAVVTEDVPDHAIVIGVPARPVSGRAMKSSCPPTRWSRARSQDRGISQLRFPAAVRASRIRRQQPPGFPAGGGARGQAQAPGRVKSAAPRAWGSFRRPSASRERS
jgi:glycosyltransferase involved in cell wall biosynthesis